MGGRESAYERISRQPDMLNNFKHNLRSYLRCLENNDGSPVIQWSNGGEFA
jgi:hypothetical protein